MADDWINSSHIVNKKEIVLGEPFLFIMLALLIPNTTAICCIAFTNLPENHDKLKVITKINDYCYCEQIPKGVAKNL